MGVRVDKSPNPCYTRLIGNNTKENTMTPDEEMLDMIIWNKTEAAWYGIPVGKYTRRQFLAKRAEENERIRKVLDSL